MKVIGVIPARWASTRFEGKPLADIAGKPMIRHVWERACQAKKLSEVLVACDDQRIFDAVLRFGGQAVMTRADHPSGTDRIAEAVQEKECDIVVNIQGDEPLMDPRVIDVLVSSLEKDLNAPIATVIKKITNVSDVSNPNVVKVVVDHKGNALYFSRAAIPYNRDEKFLGGIVYFKHLGIYAYRREFLLGFKNLPQSFLEHTEKLEQLRVLEAGYRIKTVETDQETIGVDTPEDLEKVKLMMADH